ncbi:MAG: hypothetical protein HYW51_03705 [Candidatus Doudnabacteria bacterium]|nr:hypothetical protein [Candidatus Doudnabacteria bacterium]
MNSQRGQIIIITLVFMAIVITLVVALVGYATVEIRSHRQALGRVQGLSIAEAAVETAIWKLNNQPGYTGENGTSFQAGEYNVTITDLAGGNKLIRAEAFVPSAANPRAKRVVQVTAATGTTNISFNYGVQVGQGGLEMTNSARVIGNVYSNGNIIGSNSARISGTAIAAGSSGKIDGMEVDENAMSHFLEDSSVGGSTNSFGLLRSTVGGNVVATTISNCTVGGNATFDTKASCTIGGSQTTPNPDDFIDPEAIGLPITDDQINVWEAEATAGGVIGSQVINGTVSLGPIKINGDLEVINFGRLTVTGTIWVTGKVTFSNSAIVQLAPSFGSTSGIILAGIEESTSQGFIDIKNSAQILGSGTAGSYLMLVSQRVDETAIKLTNSAQVSILYAPFGEIEITNSANLKEVVAYQLDINNSAVVTYETGLASANFSSGPAGGWEILDQTWQLIQ